MDQENISNIRKEYRKAELNKAVAGKDPVAFFEKWFKEVINSGIEEPNAMILSTVSSSGKPSSRTVLLKGLVDGRFIFYTNYNSRKGKELESNQDVAVLFFWMELERQVRVEGTARKLDPKRSDSYFKSRPAISQVSAIISPQSEVVPNREHLEKIREKYLSENKENYKRPEFWGGYEITPEYFEFWQGRRGRLHDRISFSREGEGWKSFRLAP